MTTSETHGHTDRQAVRLRQYSAVVRWMKVLLPLGAIGLVGLIFLTGQSRDAVVDAETAGNAAALSAGMRLENPRFAGVTENGEPFVVTAASALPDGAEPDRIDLETPRGELRLSGDRDLVVTAQDGTIFRKSERLTLQGNVVLETSDGYRATTSQVELDMAGGTAVAPGPIEATGPQGEIQADRLHISDNGRDGDTIIMRFEGNVRVRYRPAP